MFIESNPRKGDPDIPEFPEIEPVGRAAKNSPRLAVFNWFFVGGAQTPSPMIRPTGSISGGAVRGESQNQGSNDIAFADAIEFQTFGAFRLRLMRPT